MTYKMTFTTKAVIAFIFKIKSHSLLQIIREMKQDIEPKLNIMTVLYPYIKDVNTICLGITEPLQKMSGRTYHRRLSIWKP